MHTPFFTMFKLCPIASFNGTLVELGRPWRIEPVVEFDGGFVLSARGPVQPEVLADLADNLGLEDLGELDDHTSPSEPLDGIAGFVLVGGSTEPRSEVEASTLWWAAGKLGLLGMLPASVREAHPDVVFLNSER